MDVEGYVPAAVLFNFPSVSSLGIPYPDLLEATGVRSDVLQVCHENETLRLTNVDDRVKWLVPNGEGGMGCPRWIKEPRPEEEEEKEKEKEEKGEEGTRGEAKVEEKGEGQAEGGTDTADDVVAKEEEEAAGGGSGDGDGGGTSEKKGEEKEANATGATTTTSATIVVVVNDKSLDDHRPTAADGVSSHDGTHPTAATCGYSSDESENDPYPDEGGRHEARKVEASAAPNAVAAAVVECQ